MKNVSQNGKLFMVSIFVIYLISFEFKGEFFLNSSFLFYLQLFCCFNKSADARIINYLLQNPEFRLRLLNRSHFSTLPRPVLPFNRCDFDAVGCFSCYFSSSLHSGSMFHVFANFWRLFYVKNKDNKSNFITHIKFTWFDDMFTFTSHC